MYENQQLSWAEVPPPTLEHSMDALVKPLAVATCDLDWQLVQGKMPFPGRFSLGHEFVGRIESFGCDVQTFNIGDIVSVAFQPSCGFCSPCQLGESSACKSTPATSMFGVGKVSGDWGGAFSDLVRVPYADNMLVPVPCNIPITWLTSLSDNLADGYRIVGPFIKSDSDTDLLIFGGYDSIPLYAVAFAVGLNQKVTFVTKDSRAASNAERLGASSALVKDWPKRFRAHSITACCVQDVDALMAVIRSTRAGGHCTSTNIFQEDIALPFYEMYMRGIHLHTGRVNGAAIHKEALGWIRDGLIEPLKIDTQTVPFADVIPALQDRTTAKLIALSET